MTGVVIIGAGHSAGQLAASLRMEGYQDKIKIVGEEAYPPYERPPLSKQVLSGEMELERIFLKPDVFYAENKVELILGNRVDKIDRASKCITLDNNEKHFYEELALTTGTRVRRLAIPGSDLNGIFYVRSIDDTLALKDRFSTGGNMVVIGGGYIGLEVAAAATKQGMNVTVLEMADRVMKRVVAPEVSNFFESLHRDKGVDIRTGISLSSFEGTDSKVQSVIIGKEKIATDLVVVGVGVVPNTELAEAAGLKCYNGILVDEYTRTNDPNIVSAGDCTNHPNSIYGVNIRLESVQNAVDQSKVAAKTICGTPETYSTVPWFWSDQYDVKLQIVGLSQGYTDIVVRGDPNEGAFSVFYLKKGFLIAIDAINSPKEFMTGRKLLKSHVRPDLRRIRDVNIPIKELL